MTHYWKNESTSPVEAIVVDILTPEGEMSPSSEREPRLQGSTQSIGMNLYKYWGKHHLEMSLQLSRAINCVPDCSLFSPMPSLVNIHTKRDRALFMCFQVRF